MANTGELTERAVAGDERALQCLMLRYHDAVLAVIQRDFPVELRRVADAEDILQMTWIDVARTISGFDTARETSLFSWIRTIARRNVTDLIRFHRAAKRGGNALALDVTPYAANDDTHQSVQQLVDFALDQSPAVSRTVAAQEAMAALYLAMESLSPDHRQAIELRYIQNRSLAEIAQQMHRSETAVRGLCYRASLELRNAMGRFSRFFTSV